MADITQNFIFNPLWAQVFALLALYLTLRNITLSKKLVVGSDFQQLILVLFFGSILFAVLGLAGIPAYQLPVTLAVQAISAGIFLKILGRYTKKNYYAGWLLALNAVGFLISVTLAALQTAWFFHFWESALIVTNWGYVAYQFYEVSQYNTPKSGVLLDARGTLTKLTLWIHAVILLLVPFGGYQIPLVQMVLLPLSTLVYLWTLTFWHRRAYARMSHQRDLMEKNMNSQYEFMTRIGNAIAEKLDIDRVLDFVVHSAVKTANADGGAIFLVDEFDDVLRVKAVEGDFPPPYDVPAKVKLKANNLENFFKSTPIPLGETIIGECAATGKPIFVRDSKLDPRMVHNSRMDQIYIASLILTPLMQGKKVFGVLAIASRKSNHLFTREILGQIKTFGDYTSLTINSLYTYLQLLEKQEMERDLGIAAEIQGQLLPSHLPRVSSISLAAFSQPAKGVSGDYYDIINIRKGQILLTVCDVAGKGIPASLVMVMIRTITHLVARQPQMTVSRILDIVNWGIAGRVSLDRFATVAMLSYDFASHQLEYSNAAHHPLLIYRAEQDDFETLDTEGIPIGLERKTRYNQINTVLRKGDLIVLYTDGIIEAMNEKGQQYSLESLQVVIREHHQESPEKLKKLIIADLEKFVGKAKQHDDETFVLMRVEH